MNRRGTSLQCHSTDVYALYGRRLSRLLNRTFMRGVSWLKWDNNGSLMLQLTLQGGDGHTLMKGKKGVKYAATSLEVARGRILGTCKAPSYCCKYVDAHRGLSSRTGAIP